MTLPLVSIIIPTFNRAHLIGETLDSVLAQTYVNWECIVVDDGSTDGTSDLMAEYVKKDNRLKYVRRPDTYISGGNGARNYGFELSKGDYIQWFDSDDLMLPDKLKHKLTLFENNNYDFVVCKGAEITLENRTAPVLKWHLDNEGNLFLNHIIGKTIFGTNGPLFKRSYLKNKLLFDENLIIKQEWEFFNRLLVEKPKVGILNQHLYLYRVYSSSKRKVFNFEKIRHAMKAQRKILRLVNTSNYLNNDEDFIYRKYVFNTFLGHLRHVKIHGNLYDYLYLFITLIMSVNINLIKRSFLILKNKPQIIRNTLYLIFKK
uniref:glycosyltransferase family 2 protein n=1 Tax=Gelidibacter sp. TaxID=2018083 RepID=UPI00404959C5